jgi:hypothetical protein
MHFKYIESCDAVGYSRDPRVELEAPKLEYEYFGYENGTAIKCGTIKEYDSFKLKEKIPTATSKKAVEEFNDKRNKLRLASVEHFETKCREYFSELSPAQFDLCWSKAWEDGHSAGYDEVASYLEEYVEFCQEFTSCDGKE